MQSVHLEPQRQGLVVNVSMSLLSLLVALYALWAVESSQDELERAELRLACLELQGANDCGADGR